MLHDLERVLASKPNPAVIFEVLSPSTETYDRGEKFLRCRTQIESLREYALVSLHRPLVEHYVHQPDGSCVELLLC